MFVYSISAEYVTSRSSVCSSILLQLNTNLGPAQRYHIFDSKIDPESNPIVRVSKPRKRRRSDYSAIIVEPETKRNRAEYKYLESLHLRISVLEDLCNTASYRAGQNPQRTPETLGIGERIVGLEKTNYINHTFRTSLRDSLGNFCCPTEECDRIYKTAPDLHVHIRGKPGNGHNILKRIIDRTYCIHCDLHCNRPRDLKHHEKISHGEAYDSRIELFLGCLTQDPSQKPLVDQTRIYAASNAPAQDLDTLSSQVSQPRTSSTEPSNVLANSPGSQPFTNGKGSQAGGTCIASTNQDNQSHFSSNNAVTPEPIFPFEMLPLQGLSTGLSMDFPFDLGVGSSDVEDSRAINSSAQHPDFASPTIPLQHENVGFAEDNTTVVEFGGHHENSFPFDIFPAQ